MPNTTVCRDSNHLSPNGPKNFISTVWLWFYLYLFVQETFCDVYIICQESHYVGVKDNPHLFMETVYLAWLQSL